MEPYSCFFLSRHFLADARFWYSLFSRKLKGVKILPLLLYFFFVDVTLARDRSIVDDVDDRCTVTTPIKRGGHWLTLALHKATFLNPNVIVEVCLSWWRRYIIDHSHPLVHDIASGNFVSMLSFSDQIRCELISVFGERGAALQLRLHLVGTWTHVLRLYW